MIPLRLLAVSALAALFVSGSMAAPPPANPLVGSWILDAFVDYDADGKPFKPMGDKPVGLFIFSADGHFSFHFMRDPPVDGTEQSGPYKTLVPHWYMSYFGTYRYDPKGPGWTGRVLGGNVKSYIGTEQARIFSLKGDVMTISATYTSEGRRYRADRVLHRAPAQ